MYEKILQKLKEQKGTTSNVSDRTLEDLARSLETIINTDELLEKADLTNAIKSIDGNINHYTAKQVEEAKKNFKPEIKPEVKPVEKKSTDPKNVDIKDMISEALSPLVTEINSLKTEKVTQSRSEILQDKLKETPLIFKDATLNGFKRMRFETDEDFNSYLSEVEESAKGAIQEAKEKGLNTSVPPVNVQKPDLEEVTPEMQKAIDEVTAPKENKGKF